MPVETTGQSVHEIGIEDVLQGYVSRYRISREKQ